LIKENSRAELIGETVLRTLLESATKEETDAILIEIFTIKASLNSSDTLKSNLSQIPTRDT
jgi:hypothetical protein